MWESNPDGMRGKKLGEKNEPKIMGHCASTVHTIKHRPGAESLSNYSPINASGMITVTAQDNYAGPSSERRRRKKKGRRAGN